MKLSTDFGMRGAALLLRRRLDMLCVRVMHPGDDRGQTTAEYALVIIGAAAVAMLLLAWATGTGKITDLLDKVVGAVADLVR